MIPIIKTDIEYTNLIIVIHFTFSITGSKPTCTIRSSQKVPLGLVQTLVLLTISSYKEKVTFWLLYEAFSKPVDYLSHIYNVIFLGIQCGRLR